MKSSVYSVIPMASLALAIGFTAPAGAQDATASLVIEVQQLQDEVRMLRGQIEEMGYEIENLKRRQRDQYLDLDNRLNQLGQGAAPGTTPGTATTPAGVVAPTQDDAPATAEPDLADAEPRVGPVTEPPAEDVPEVRPPMEPDTELSGLATPSAASTAAAQTPEAEKAAYDQAFQALKDLRYADAAEGFQDFLRDYPDSEYADNAQYWLGESYYVTRNYDIALEAFQGLLRDYPESAKAPDALLKIGYTHYELKQWEQARAALTQVQSQYPGTTLARLAESRLRSMRLEGRF